MWYGSGLTTLAGAPTHQRHVRLLRRHIRMKKHPSGICLPLLNALCFHTDLKATDFVWNFLFLLALVVKKYMHISVFFSVRGGRQQRLDNNKSVIYFGPMLQVRECGERGRRGMYLHKVKVERKGKKRRKKSKSH